MRSNRDLVDAVRSKPISVGGQNPFPAPAISPATIPVFHPQLETAPQRRSQTEAIREGNRLAPFARVKISGVVQPKNRRGAQWQNESAQPSRQGLTQARSILC